MAERLVVTDFPQISLGTDLPRLARRQAHSKGYKRFIEAVPETTTGIK